MQPKGNAQEKSLLRRLLSTEAMLCCVGIASMVYGVVDGLKVIQLFFGVCIVAGSVFLHFVRQKDWDAHWAELDRVRKAHEERMAEESEKKG